MKLGQDFGVRALLAVMVITGHFVSLFTFGLRGDKELFQMALQAGSPIVMAVATFYFATRAAQPPPPPGPPAPPWPPPPAAPPMP